MIKSLIREYTSKNIKSFMKLYRLMYNDEFSSDSDLRMDIETDMEESYDILIYLEDDKIVGCVYIDKLSTFAEKEYDEDIFYISNLFVLKEYRKRGIASKLIEEVENIAKKQGINMLASSYNINNKISAQVHRKNGFRRVAKTIQVIKNI